MLNPNRRKIMIHSWSTEETHCFREVRTKFCRSFPITMVDNEFSLVIRDNEIQGVPLLPEIKTTSGNDSRFKEVDETFWIVMLLVSTCLFCAMLLTSQYVAAYNGVSVSSTILLRRQVQTILSVAFIFVLMVYRTVFKMNLRTVCFVTLWGFFGGAAISFHIVALNLIPFGIFSSPFYISTYCYRFTETILTLEKTHLSRYSFQASFFMRNSAFSKCSPEFLLL